MASELGACVMTGLFTETIFGIPWAVVSIVAFSVAIIFFVIDTGAGIEGWRWIVLRWFHPWCWVFLGLAALCKTAALIPAAWAAPLAAIGGLLYLIFVIVLIMQRVGSA
jgi:hypothetical protein